MQLIGQSIKHVTFGKGVVTDWNGNVITVCFSAPAWYDSHSTLPPTQAGLRSVSGGALFPGGGITKGSIVWSTAAFLSVSWAWARCSSG